MVVAVSMLYLPPSEGEFCVKIEENAQISKAKYLVFFLVSLCLKISKCQSFKSVKYISKLLIYLKWVSLSYNEVIIGILQVID